MRSNIAASSIRVAKRGFDFSLNEDEENYHVTKDAVQTRIRVVHWANRRGDPEGLEIDVAGVESHEERMLLFFRPYLIEDGVASIEPTDHFLLSGERYDLDEDHAIVVDTGPNGGTSPTIEIVARKAVELASTLPGTEFGFE